MSLDEIVACYLLDRADQYQVDSGCWVALADAAKNIMLGEHRKSFAEGEFDDGDLQRRLRRMAGVVRPVDPKMGVEP